MDTDPILRRRARRAPAALVLLALLGACGGSEDASAAGRTGGEAASSAGAAPAPAARTTDERTATYRPGPPLANPGAEPQDAPERPRAGGLDVDELGFTRGAPDAPVRVVEFSDFGCGYCAQFHREAWPALHRDYVVTGKVQWKMVPFDVGMFPHARQAVLAGECAGEQGRFEDVRERLFESQRTWKSATAAAALALFRDLAREEDLDVDRFNRCMAQGWRAPRVDASNALARQLGVRGTPTFYILGFGIVPGALPAEEFSKVLDRVLAAQAEPGS